MAEGIQAQAAGDKVSAFIREARLLLKPAPVKVNHVPGWFRRALLAAYGCPKHSTTGYAVLQHAEARCAWHWLDHWGSIDWRGTSAFVSEPYDLDENDLANVACLCRRCNLEYRISSNSWWFPGRTIRILICHKQEETCPIRPLKNGDV